ncbi:nitrogen fixation protein NifB [Formivibrio citricus]|uniref:FeMo cofactor biosynthesis protein NifB n=1 Tax=Formivibrio citricus TaxID=83765 RepID=A0A1I4YX07_9NEIS|nr:nitrogenase cofactor biosynthesis protein NifB [Formivibrio citricus]SFN42199.1 nitrogen fixation protein NifB [Formivibrio citricus]
MSAQILPFASPASACGSSHGECHDPRVADHPCYSKDAHHKYARLHLPVAPACNIQCNYCNRKYDCSNESRPGVVSEVLSPEEAARKVLAVADAIPQLSVVGIAGPGDAFANWPRTSATLRAVKKMLPALKLCLSSNGLNVAPHVGELAELGVDHVTLTINTLEPEIAARIYPWVFWEHKRWRGLEAAEILIREQWRAAAALTAAGVLVKINSVYIPGLNDDELPKISAKAAGMGVAIHNIMPLISDPAHGTHFGLSGQRAPSEEEIESVRARCAAHLPQMGHCHQCRADAVGMLGEDRGAEFAREHLDSLTLDAQAIAARHAAVQASLKAGGGQSWKIAVASADGQRIDQHFGHAEAFRIYESDGQSVKLVALRRTAAYCQGPSDCGDDDAALPKLVQSLADCAAILAVRIGHAPWKKLEQAGIQPVVEHAFASIEASVLAVAQKLLEQVQEAHTKRA